MKVFGGDAPKSITMWHTLQVSPIFMMRKLNLKESMQGCSTLDTSGFAFRT